MTERKGLEINGLFDPHGTVGILAVKSYRVYVNVLKRTVWCDLCPRASRINWYYLNPLLLGSGKVMRVIADSTALNTTATSSN